MFIIINFYLKYNNNKSFFNEHSDYLFLSSSFCFKNSYQAEFFFKNSFIYNIYSRFKNPTLDNLKNKISFLEKSEFCIVVSSGMASVVSLMLVFLNSGDNIISSRNLFSSTLNFFINILIKFNIYIFFISSFNLNLIFNVFLKKSKLVFIESPSNPLIEIFDINFLSYLSKKFNKLFIIDNTFCTPISQNPLNLGSDIVIHSCTKFLDGQSRVLGGALLSNNKFLIKQIFNFLRISGFMLSVFDAWLINKSIDTLILRLNKQNINSLFFLQFLKNNIYIYNIFYPSYNLFYKKIFSIQQILSGSIISFNLKGFCFELQRINSWKLLNNLSLVFITPNLGDLKTIITQPSVTTHGSLFFYEKILITLPDSFLRLSFGIENINDIIYDFFLIFKNYYI
ncbi:O-succinylhomoserine sulfhydrylase [Candidatus Nasuia deltocephalinicola]|nr:O-succinylhomoserine sulfhydrylase [Candidatus Nasuia deltocephalinicola]